MARIRTIKPEFFTSEDIVSLSPLARLLYIALWCEADREGRMAWKPKTFKMRYMPADDADINALCAEIVSAGLVVLYGEGLAYIPKFSAHQHVNPREAASNLPVPDACARVTDTQVGRKEGEGREGKEGSSVPKGTDAAVASAPKSEKSPEDQAKADLWLAAVAVLKAGGCDSEPLARSFMGRLVKDFGLEAVRSAVASAATAQPADAREYLKATCQWLKGERKDPVTVAESPMRDVAQAELARQAAHTAVAAPSDVRERLAKAKAALTLAGVASTLKDAA